MVNRVVTSRKHHDGHGRFSHRQASCLQSSQMQEHAQPEISWVVTPSICSINFCSKGLHFAHDFILAVFKLSSQNIPYGKPVRFMFIVKVFRCLYTKRVISFVCSFARGQKVLFICKEHSLFAAVHETKEAFFLDRKCVPESVKGE